jgi:hypothetical protein
MNRVSIRGVGFAAAAMVATSLAVGSHTIPADAQEAGTSVPHVSPLALSLFGNSGTSLLAFPRPAAGLSPWESGSAELALVHDARGQGLAKVSAQGQAVAARIAAARLAAARKAARERALSRANRMTVRPVVPGTLRAVGQEMAAARGWTGVQWQCLDNIWMRESGWSITAENPSGAYGIPQASPGSKMASAGADWRTNPVTQIAWGLGYISNAYGNPCSAWAFWQTHNWY